MKSISPAVQWGVQKLILVLLIASLFCIAKFLQHSVFIAFCINSHIAFFSLPAAVMTLAALVTPFIAMPGLFIGNLVVNYIYDTGPNQLDLITQSLIPVLAIAIVLVTTFRLCPPFREFHQSDDRLSRIDAIDIFYFCVLYAVVDGILWKLAIGFELIDQDPFPVAMIGIKMFGNLTGSFLVFVAINLMFSLYIRLRRL